MLHTDISKFVKTIVKRFVPEQRKSKNPGMTKINIRSVRKDPINYRISRPI